MAEFHLKNEERWNVFVGNRNEIVDEFICWAEEEDYNASEVSLAMDFLVVDRKKLKTLKKIKKDFDLAPRLGFLHKKSTYELYHFAST